MTTDEPQRQRGAMTHAMKTTSGTRSRLPGNVTLLRVGSPLSLEEMSELKTAITSGLVQIGRTSLILPATSLHISLRTSDSMESS